MPALSAFHPTIRFLAVAGGLAACNPHVRGGPVVPHPITGPAGPRPNPSGGIPQSPNAAAAIPEVRHVCRIGGITSAWIAIDFEVGDECPSSGPDGEHYTGALVVRHADFPRDARLLVCADQRIPSGWTREPLTNGAPVEGQCRSSNPAPTGTERVMLIHRRP